MAAVDYNNLTGWRHQHSGVRLQFDNLYDNCFPDWRNMLNLGFEVWIRQKRVFMKRACEFLGIHCPACFVDHGVKVEHCQKGDTSDKFLT
eukprot:5351140-Karenia_brevis.AAC.1